MTVTVSPHARDDLKEAFEYIHKDNPQAANRVLAHLVEMFGFLASGAVTGREVVLRDGRRVNTWPVPPYRIYYRKNVDRLEIIRVYHQARRPIERS
jgi:plasmid stabilization system protein ParE